MAGSELLIRARNADGTFIADDPATPDVDEAWRPFIDTAGQEVTP